MKNKRDEHLVQKVTEFFRANPDKFYMTTELAKKFRCSYIGSLIFRIRKSLLWGQIVTERSKRYRQGGGMYKYVDV